MQSRGTDAIPLAPRPNLEQYRKLAKDLVKALRVDGPPLDAVGEWAKEFIERLARLQHESATPEYVDREARHLNWRHIEREAERIVRDAKSTPEFTPGAGVALTDAQLFVARLHGFEGWPQFVRHLEARTHSASEISQFELAADAIVTGDIATLGRLLSSNPSLVRQRSTRDHHGTLLHYIAANGHEGFRQRSPKNAVDVARRLLDAGAEPDALADMYGHRCTTMQMLVSSVHPHKAGVMVPLVDVLIDYGAAVDGVNHDGSPILTAFRFHYPDAANAIARRGATIDNVLSAAALGRMDLLARFVNDDGTLAPDVRLDLAPWPRLSKNHQRHLGYALTWACTFDQPDAAKLLLRKGAPPDGKDDDMPAIHAAAAFGHIDLVRLLMSRGVSLELLNSYDGTVLSGVIWYAFEAPQDGVDYAAIVRELLALGARTDVYREMQAHVDLVLAGRRGGGYP